MEFRFVAWINEGSRHFAKLFPRIHALESYQRLFDCVIRLHIWHIGDRRRKSDIQLELLTLEDNWRRRSWGM
jgi:hypothetical protein